MSNLVSKQVHSRPRIQDSAESQGGDELATLHLIRSATRFFSGSIAHHQLFNVDNTLHRRVLKGKKKKTLMQEED